MYLRLSPLLLSFLLAAAWGTAPLPAAPLGLYVTTPQEKNAAVPVGTSGGGVYRSGFTLRPGAGWRFYDPVLPLDFTYLKPWINRRGTAIEIRIRRLRIDTADLAEAARRDRPPGGRGLQRLAPAPFRTTGGLAGLRVGYGNRREVLFTATYFDNQRGDLCSFDAVAESDADRRMVDALLNTLALEKRTSGRR